MASQRAAPMALPYCPAVSAHHVQSGAAGGQPERQARQPLHGIRRMQRRHRRRGQRRGAWRRQRPRRQWEAACWRPALHAWRLHGCCRGAGALLRRAWGPPRRLPCSSLASKLQLRLGRLGGCPESRLQSITGSQARAWSQCRHRQQRWCVGTASSAGALAALSWDAAWLAARHINPPHCSGAMQCGIFARAAHAASSRGVSQQVAQRRMLQSKCIQSCVPGWTA